tara:strand:- start:182 stop:292 length:111 start_codon:yes stop_codon:yes gene_type:complete
MRRVLDATEAAVATEEALIEAATAVKTAAVDHTAAS